MDRKTGQVTEIRNVEKGMNLNLGDRSIEQEWSRKDIGTFDDRRMKGFESEDTRQASRASSKAIQLLGMSKVEEKESKSIKERIVGSRKRKVEHFRPVPT